VTQLQLHIHIDKTAPDEVRFTESDDLIRDVAKELKPRNILFQALPMNATDPKVYRKLLDLGVESFATDHPQLTLDVVKQYASEKRSLP
jgi:glycerophosphoryl diester phosphodiesterase